MNRVITVLAALIILFLPHFVSADVPEYYVKRATEKIVLDGILDEGDWAAAEPVGDFVFPWWTSGEKEQTEVKMLWNDTYLYLAFKCDDKHIWADHYNINDPVSRDDCVELFWNPSPDEQSYYYQFEINCIGNLLSVKKPDRKTIMLPHITQSIQGTVNDDTDTDTGWIIEMALRFSEYTELFSGETPASGDMWRIGLNRCGGKTNPQYSQWSPSQTDKPNFHRPDDFGKLFFSGEPVSGTGKETILFEESFEDTNWGERGWYDGPTMEITADEHIPGSGHSCVWHWEKAGDIGPAGGGARAPIAPVSSVFLSFYMKHSDNWGWTGRNYHPHEFHFITNVDDRYIGPAYTHLTFYVEVVNGVPRMIIQDSMNIDESRVGQNLVGITENRSVAGGNGDSDGYGDGDCYSVGDVHRNGKFWEPGKVYFSDDSGAYYKGDWHHVKAQFVLNSIKDGTAVKDGKLRYWFDGELIMDYDDVVFRTGQHTDMKINQFLMTPYFGPGVPHEQWIWIDDLKITTDEEI